MGIYETCGGEAVPKARHGSALAGEAGPPLAVTSSSTTMSAGLLKSSGRIGQARWWRSFSRIGCLGEQL